MTKEEYSIKEVLDMLNISRTTLYSKLNRYEKELIPYITNKQGKKYIFIEGINILKNPDNCADNLNNYTDNLNNLNNDNNSEIVELLKNHLSDKDIQIVALNNQLKVKDTQIQSLADALGKSQKLNENNQILLNQAQQKILYLEQTNNKSYWWQFWKKS